MIRPCREKELPAVLRIINEAAVAYRGVIPADRWHEPYMSMEELRGEIDDGVDFWCVDKGKGPVAVMGIQDRGEVELIRHAYTLPAYQKKGLGSKLLSVLASRSNKPLLVGTWAAAVWAVRFYERNGFHLVTTEEKDRLLVKYWKIPARQVETSVVLSREENYDDMQDYL